METDLLKDKKNLDEYFELAMKFGRSERNRIFYPGASTEGELDLSNAVDRGLFYKMAYKFHHAKFYSTDLKTYKEKLVFLLNIKAEALRNLKSEEYSSLLKTFLEETDIEIEKCKELTQLFPEGDSENDQNDKDITLRMKVISLMLLTFRNWAPPLNKSKQNQIIKLFHSITGGDIKKVSGFVKNPTKVKENKQSVDKQSVVNLCKVLFGVRDQFQKAGFDNFVKLIQSEIDALEEITGISEEEIIEKKVEKQKKGKKNEKK